MGAALWIQGKVDIEALSESFDELLRRHEILRSRVQLVADRPQQVIEPFKDGLLRFEDLRADATATTTAMGRVNDDLRGVFDLNKESVLRARLLQTGDECFLFGMVLHHIAGDQWSMGIFGRELATLYNYRRNGLSAPLEPLPISYRDFSHWQRNGAGATDIEQQLQFWTKQLTNLPAVDLPIDLPRPKVWTMNGSFYQRDIPPHLFNAAVQLARSNGSTLFMTLFAGFAALLQRLTGQTDLPIGVPVANRTVSSVESLIGTFVNTVIVRADVKGDPGFSELLQRVRSTALDAFANQDVSFDRLVQELGQRGDRSRAPLAQVLFNVTNAPMYGIELSGLDWENAVLDRGGAQFELTFTVDTEFTKSLSIEFNTDLFERSTIERLAGQYFALLEAAAAAPAARISGLNLLPQEQRAVLEAWNASSLRIVGRETFPSLFEAQAARTPAAVAVSFQGVSLSYGELNQRANGLAHALRKAGVGRGQMVGVCVPRSELLPIGLLGVQKSGAAYVPLDPNFPAERLKYMLADSGAKALLTAGPLPQGFDVPADVSVIDVAKHSPSVTDSPNHGPGLKDTAYVLYTSGSTGRPKGVAVPHGALVNFLWSMREAPGLQQSDVLAAVTTISFDIAGLELYLPLLVGARIELVPKEVATDGTSLSNLLQSSGATLLQATPATWRMLIDAGWNGSKSLRALCGGEGLPRKLADEILERVAELWNMYGPTETTIWSTLDRVEKGEGAITIGKPIANTQVHIVDASGQIAPIGIVGEICIGGDGVAVGYHGRPALTSEKFVADEHSGVPGARLYRTGDLGRWGADGRLYHLGRSDHQVKIRGFRIELGEIEKAIGSHPAVSQAVAVVREARADDLRLIAYIVFNEGEDVTSTEMKRFLRSELPDYMIPSIIVPLLSVPLTPNGKVDRAALPDPFAGAREEAPVTEAPASQTEQMLAEIWKSVLKVEHVQPLDNFFELGGYSLLSLRVAKLIEKRSGKRLDPRILFFNNLREVAQILDGA
jgi:nonribosomal peptide synthetase DhbF